MSIPWHSKILEWNYTPRAIALRHPVRSAGAGSAAWRPATSPARRRAPRARSPRSRRASGRSGPRGVLSDFADCLEAFQIVCVMLQGVLGSAGAASALVSFFFAVEKVSSSQSFAVFVT